MYGEQGICNFRPIRTKTMLLINKNMGNRIEYKYLKDFR